MILAMVFVYVVTSFCFIQEKHEQKHNTNILLRLNHAVYGHVYGMGRQFEIVFRIFFICDPYDRRRFVVSHGLQVYEWFNLIMHVAL